MTTFFNAVFYSVSGAIFGNYCGIFYYNYCIFFKQDFLIDNKYSIFDYSYYSSLLGSISFIIYYNIKNRLFNYRLE